MPLDLAGDRKLFPDSSVNFKWQHSPIGFVTEDSTYYIRTPRCDGKADHAEARAQGFMCDRNSDWKNVEQKIYFDGETGDKSLVLHMGGSVTAEYSPCSCFAYKMSFSSNGLIKLRKQIYFGNSVIMKEVDNGSLPSGFKGVAFIRYNINNNSNVVLEAWVDKGTNNTWKRAMRIVDDGNTYGNGGTRCGSGNDREAGVWGFPAVAFTNKGFDYNYLNATAREINAHGGFNEAQYRSGIRKPLGGGGGTPLPGDIGGDLIT